MRLSGSQALVCNLHNSGKVFNYMCKSDKHVHISGKIWLLYLTQADGLEQALFLLAASHCVHISSRITQCLHSSWQVPIPLDPNPLRASKGPSQADARGHSVFDSPSMSDALSCRNEMQNR